MDLPVLIGECIHAKVVTLRGYGRVYHQGKNIIAHRLAYCQHHGVTLDSIKGLVVRHMCDNPPCINPNHLLIGTIADNNRDAKERNRLHKWNGTRSGEKNPRSKLSEADVIKIRERYKAGSSIDGARAIGIDYGVARATISDIIRGKRWKRTIK